MNDRPRIIVGLVVFVVLALFPVWYGLAAGGDAGRPELELPDPTDRSLFPTDEAYHCVEDLPTIRADHVNLLDHWRDAVVRDGEKHYVSQAFDTTYEMSLTRTCMNCHQSRETFCARCHEYADVGSFHRLEPTGGDETPQYGIDCWDCHVDRGGIKP